MHTLLEENRLSFVKNRNTKLGVARTSLAPEFARYQVPIRFADAPDRTGDAPSIGILDERNDLSAYELAESPDGANERTVVSLLKFLSDRVHCSVSTVAVGNRIAHMHGHTYAGDRYRAPSRG